MDYTPIPLIDKLFFSAEHKFMSTKNHAHSHEDRHALKIRVRKIAGQLRAIEEMIDEDRDCTEILTQVVSARRAMKSFAEKLINEHLHHCIDGAQKQEDGKRKLKDLLQVLERYIE